MGRVILVITVGLIVYVTTIIFAHVLIKQFDDQITGFVFPSKGRSPHPRVKEMVVGLGRLLVASICASVAMTHTTGRFRIETYGVCIRCGYNLTGNMSGRCPECGTDVDTA